MDATDRLLKDFVEHFNHGMETGDFRALLDLFTPDVKMRYSGLNRPAYNGREEVAAGYRRQPPKDEIEILDTRINGDELIVGYSWLQSPDIRAGEMRMTVANGLVKELEIIV